MAQQLERFYCEDLTAPMRLRLRALQPSDKAKLTEGFARLSPMSRYLRYFGRKNALSVEELRRLTEFDVNEDFVLGAFELSPDGVEGGLTGVARYSRVPAGGGPVAEFAVAVIDDFQSRGIGTALMQRLLAVARRCGVRRMHCSVLAWNARMCRLVQRTFGAPELRREGDMLVGEFPVAGASAQDTPPAGNATDVPAVCLSPVPAASAPPAAA